jgi:hypothetical protein
MRADHDRARSLTRTKQLKPKWTKSYRRPRRYKSFWRVYNEQWTSRQTRQIQFGENEKGLLEYWFS